MQTYKTFQVTNSAGAAKFLALVADTSGSQKAKLPTAANVSQFVCATDEDQLTQNRNVRGIVDGEAFLTASGAITVGDAVNIAGTTGKIQSCQTSLLATSGGPAMVHVIGYALDTASADGDVIRVRLAVFSKCTPT